MAEKRGGARPGAGRPKLGRKPVLVRGISLTRAMYAQLDKRAARLGITRSHYIRQALTREFRREDRERARNDARGVTVDDRTRRGPPEE